MNLKAFFQKNLIHIGVLAFMVLLTIIYFKPQLEGYALKQHDVEQWIGMSNEAKNYRTQTGDEALWTNSMFGGMPTDQISLIYPGNWFKELVDWYNRTIPHPISMVLLHMLSFYVFARLIRLNPLVSLVGAIAFAFASYELIVIQAGHFSKSATVSMLPAIFGAFIYAYRTNRLWGVILSGIFMTIELAMNHLQVTYYFSFILLFTGLYFFYEAIRDKKLKSFAITTVSVIAVYAISAMANSGNIMMTLNYSNYTIRGKNDVSIASDGTKAVNQSNGLDKDYITSWSYGKGETFTFISPYVKGGGTMALADSPFREQIENSDLTTEEINSVLGNNSYWGEQPGTAGPVYLGVVVVLLAFLGLIFLRDKIKWPLFIVAVLAVMLSWGKNFMGLTDFFIENVPGYNKFRTVTMILVLVEMIVPIIGVLFLDQLIKEHEHIREKKKPLLIALGGFFVFLIVVKAVGLSDGYSSTSERSQMDQIKANIEQQVRELDPVQAKTQLNVDITQPQQVSAFADQQAEKYYKDYDNVKEARKQIFHSSMNRSILFVFLAGLLFVFFVFSSSKMAPTILVSGLVVLTLADLLPVSYNYLGNQEDDRGEYKYWVESGLSAYPISTNEGDEQILANELQLNPALKSKVDKAVREGKLLADELGYTGMARNNLINSYRFSALNMNTNYRVFDLNGGFSSSRASYYHKSLGGYHGAKLRNINNIFEFHLSKMNNKVYDILNVKYFLQQGQDGAVMARPNPTAIGPAWLVKRVEQYATPNDEIRALGTQFKLTNAGQGTLLVNQTPMKEATIYGGEKLQYLMQGRDTISVPLSNGITEGMEAMLVMDVNGKTDLVPMMTMSLDTAKSFTPLVALKATNEFKPQEEAVMLQSEAKELTAKQFSGEGTIRMVKYSPNRMVYKANVKGKQLAVFSEIYYPDWKAFVDGKETPIRKVNYLLRGVELSDGDHKIEFVYDKTRYQKANNIARVGSALLVLLIAAGFFVQWRKKKKQPDTTA